MMGTFDSKVVVVTGGANGIDDTVKHCSTDSNGRKLIFCKL